MTVFTVFTGGIQVNAMPYCSICIILFVTNHYGIVILIWSYSLCKCPLFR